MTIRFASLIAAGALAALTTPALAQDADGAGPPERGEWRGPPPRPMPGPGGERFERRAMPPMRAMPGPRPGYSPDERGAWMDQCHANFRGPDRRDGPGGDYCEQYMGHYESGMPGPAMGPGLAPPMAWQPGYVTPGYMVPPLVWVRVPIVHERRGCGCEEVIEEEVITRPAPRARRVIHRRVHEKRVKYSR